MKRVETFFLTKGKTPKAEFSALADICHKSKNLYNYANYILRQVATGKIENIQEFADLVSSKRTSKTIKDGSTREFENFAISEYELSKRLTAIRQTDYVAMKAQCAQQTLKLLFRNHKSFRRACAEYAKNPSKFLGRPRLPKYKDKNGMSVAVYTNQSATIDGDGFLQLAKGLTLSSVRTTIRNGQFKQSRIVPRLGCFKVEIVYEKSDGESELLAKSHNLRKFHAAIDLCVDNLATVTSDDWDSRPLIVSGGPVKSVNQLYNKRMAEVKSEYARHGLRTGNALRRLTIRRNLRVRDYLHKASRRVADWCASHHVGTVFVGLNHGWKQWCGMGRNGNQNFVQIPFDTFVSQLRYKLEDYGISLVTVNEAYTSKCSALDREAVGKHDDYIGRRVRRGLFRCSDGRLLNADVNGSLNILRVGLGKSDLGTADGARLFNPWKVGNIDTIRDAVRTFGRPADRRSVSERNAVEMHGNPCYNGVKD